MSLAQRTSTTARWRGGDSRGGWPASSLGECTAHRVFGRFLLWVMGEPSAPCVVVVLGLATILFRQLVLAAREDCVCAGPREDREPASGGQADHGAGRPARISGGRLRQRRRRDVATARADHRSVHNHRQDHRDRVASARSTASQSRGARLTWPGETVGNVLTTMTTPSILGRHPLLVIRVALDLLVHAFEEHHHLRIE
jgi:hypothetical protein